MIVRGMVFGVPGGRFLGSQGDGFWGPRETVFVVQGDGFWGQGGRFLGYT